MAVDIDTVARTIFEDDPSSKWEAPWEHLAEYKKDAWRQYAEIAQIREGLRD